MLKKDEISQAHPIFELYPETIKCVFFGQVKKINTKKQVQLRYLLITNAAIFLLVKKKFPSGFRLSRFITYNDLSHITITSGSEHAALHGEETSNGSGDNYIISIYTHAASEGSSDPNASHLALQYEMSNPKDAAEIVARMLMIKSSFFPTSKEILDPSTPENIRELINQSNYLFETNSIFADRFLSLCVVEDSSPQLNHQIIELYNLLSEINNEVHFTSQMLSYIFIPQFTESIARSPTAPFHDKPFEVIFEKGNYDKIAKCLQILFSECSFLEKITFNGVIFSSLDNPSDLFPASHQTSLNTITFINSNLKSNDFKHLISDLNHYKGKITTLEIHDSDIDDHNFRFLFNTIFDAQCFRHLKTLSLSGLEMDVQLYIMQFLGSNNVLKNKTIETLSVNNSTLSIENMLLNITLFETGLKNLVLTRCQFLNPIPPNAITTFQQLQTIDMSSTQFTSNALLSLFKELSTVASNEKSPAPSNIILNDLDISNDDLMNFYNNLNGSITISTLTKFSWKNNKITEKNIDSFFAFLKKQINLREIDLSFSLIFEDGQTNQSGDYNDVSATPFKKIAEYLKMMKIESLSICGESSSAYKGEYFNIILSAFNDRLLQLSKDDKEKNHISKIKLDVRGQQIGLDGVELLTKMINEFPSFYSLYFKHTSAPIESLITLTTAMLDIKSGLHKTLWPEKDVKESLHKVNPSDRVNFLNTTNELKKKFERRFGKSSIPKAQTAISDGLKAAASIMDRNNPKSKFSILPSQAATQNAKQKKADKGKVSINMGQSSVSRPSNSRDFRKRGCTTANASPKLIGIRNENTNSVLHMAGLSGQGNVQDYLETLVSMKEQMIDSLLAECIGPNEVEIQKDPLVIAMKQIQKSVDI